MRADRVASFAKLLPTAGWNGDGCAELGIAIVERCVMMDHGLHAERGATALKEGWDTVWKIAGRLVLAALMAVTTSIAVASAPDQLYVAQADAAWTLEQLHGAAAPELDQRHVAKHLAATFGPVEFNGPFETANICQFHLETLANDNPDWCYGRCGYQEANAVKPGYAAGYYFFFRRRLD